MDLIYGGSWSVEITKLMTVATVQMSTVLVVVVVVF